MLDAFDDHSTLTRRIEQIRSRMQYILSSEERALLAVELRELEQRLADRNIVGKKNEPQSMTSTSARSDQTIGDSRSARLFRANAFRVLSLSADTELKQIYRQQQRLLNALELGELDGTNAFTFLPQRHVSKEEILEAVGSLEQPDDRLVEELFWLHELDGKFDLRTGRLDNVLEVLREVAESGTTRGAVAKHNLAVIRTVLAQELPGSRRFDHWDEALKTWKTVIDDDVFWNFVEDRALRGGGQVSDTGLMRVAVCQQLGSILSEELANAVRSREPRAMTALSGIALDHRSWLNADAELISVGAQVIKDGSVSLGGVLDRLSEIAEQGDKAIVRSSLATRENEIGSIANEYRTVIHTLGQLADANGWDDAIGSCYQKLSVAYFNLLDDQDEALRLIVQARRIAHDPKLIESIDRGWQHVQRAIMCAEANTLLKSSDYVGAEQKLEAALALSTEEQKDEIKELQDGCRRARVFCRVDATKKSPTLYTLNGIGATFYGNRDFDPNTRSYVTNHWFTFFFVPVFPLGAYRVSDAGSRLYHIYGKVPLSNFLKKSRWAIVATILVLILVSNYDGCNSSSSSSSEQSGTSYGTTNTSLTPTKTGNSASDSSGISAGAYQSEKDAIETERTALSALSQSLDDRKSELDAEGAKMDELKSYLAGVESSYSSDAVPESVRSQYKATLADYNSRVPEYNRKVTALKADSATYDDRVNAFNARVHRYNASR
jgi:hypothetical protein